LLIGIWMLIAPSSCMIMHAHGYVKP
jgi:hypothetical protein